MVYRVSPTIFTTHNKNTLTIRLKLSVTKKSCKQLVLQLYL